MEGRVCGLDGAAALMSEDHDERVPLVIGPYSTEPVTTGPSASPPVRITYRSPSPVSKRSSGGTRESMQERIEPKGSCVWDTS
ncbi:hypothetical protein GCM10010341_57380 [Streptomyces noursei]|nr:hypothetical protein GCM10010341_57380 [Streptomyces noursei]